MPLHHEEELQIYVSRLVYNLFNPKFRAILAVLEVLAILNQRLISLSHF